MFFSLVVPTRNRPMYVRDTIYSVLRQDFSDFELVVSDNSEPPCADLASEIRALGDARVRYLSPARSLSMGDHWEFATADLRGEYIGVVGDRWMLFRRALTRLRDEIERTQAKAISYTGAHLYSDDPPLYLRRPRFSGRTDWFGSRAMAEIASVSVFASGLPTLANSFVRTDVFDEMRHVYNGVLRGSVAPDVSFGVHLLDTVDGFHYFDYPLALNRGLERSNGHLIDLGQRLGAAGEFKSDIDRRGGLVYAPIPWVYTNHNIRIHEYGRARERQRTGRLLEIDKEQYYLSLHFELCEHVGEDRRARMMVERYRCDHNLATRRRVRGGIRAAVRSSRLKPHIEWFLNGFHRAIGVNVGNRPAGRYSSIEAIIDDEAANSPKPNMRRSGVLNPLQRIWLREAARSKSLLLDSEVAIR